MGDTYAWASPEVVGHMTMAQLTMYLKTNDKETPSMQQRPAGAFGSNAERDAWVADKQKEKGSS